VRSKTTFVIPVVQPPDRIPARETWDVKNIVVIDNTTLGSWETICAERGWAHVTFHRNIGVAAAWNLGAQWSFFDGSSFVAFVSSSVWWEHGLSSFAAVIKEGADSRGLLTELAFHASAWNVRVFEQIGWFDESPYPAYNEDTDWLRRLELSGLHVPPERAETVMKPPNVMPKWGPSATCEDAVSLKSGAVNVDFAKNERWYRAKWGGPKHDEQYEKPYGLWVPLSYAPTMRDW